MKTYYEMLDVPATASSDEIKRAFRREIAKYHPDKVQHLGKEFQDIAALKAAELTQAYKTLSDPILRSDYDATLGGTAAPVDVPAPKPSSAAAPRPRSPEAPESSAGGRPGPNAGPSSFFQQERAGANEMIRRATVARFRQALRAEYSASDDMGVPGFEVACAPKPSFWSKKPPPGVLGRFVEAVNAASLAETWTLASRAKREPQRELCVFLMGPSLAPAAELARAISDQRRRPMPGGGKLTLVPVNTTDWSAHVPNDAPAVVKSLLERLKRA